MCAFGCHNDSYQWGPSEDNDTAVADRSTKKFWDLEGGMKEERERIENRTQREVEHCQLILTSTNVRDCESLQNHSIVWCVTREF